MQLTSEQTEICQAVATGESIMVEALAGCAKSTTIVESLRHVPPSQSTVIITFARKNREDMEAKIKEADLVRPNLFVKTANALGHAALQKSLSKRLTLDNDKIFVLAKENGLKGDDLADGMLLARSARMAGIIPAGIVGKSYIPDTDENWHELCLAHDIDPILITPARTILRSSTLAALAGTIDYDDQIYISTLIFGAYAKYDRTFVDEAQDLSRMNHDQVRKCARAQIVAVGDSHQAIYAWRGADSDSMRNLRSLRSAWIDKTLSVTFRCPRRVVERQQSFVPNFRAGPQNLEGSIRVLKDWTPEGGPSAAVLCRNNAPLVRLAFRLLRQKIPVNVLGKDIGRDMKRLYNKLSNKGQRSMTAVMDECRAQISEDPDKFDRLESLLAVLESSTNVEDALEWLTQARTHAVALATGHKAKGLEWSTVYHLEPQLIPSKYAVANGGAALAQEYNLRYVIETRSKNELFFVKQDNLME